MTLESLWGDSLIAIGFTIFGFAVIIFFMVLDAKNKEITGEDVSAFFEKFSRKNIVAFFDKYLKSFGLVSLIVGVALVGLIFYNWWTYGRPGILIAIHPIYRSQIFVTGILFSVNGLILLLIRHFRPNLQSIVK